MKLAMVICAALTVPLTIAGSSLSKADIFDFGPIGPCYDYDPYDYYHLYGKYYPYPKARCRHGSQVKNYVVKPLAAPTKAEGCVKTNVKKFKNRCSN